MQPPPPPGWYPPGSAGYGYPPLPPPAFPPPPPRPGSVPLRPLEIGDILDGSFQTVRRNPRGTLGPAAIVAVVQAVCVAAFQFLLYGSRSAPSVTDPNAPGTSGGQAAAQLTAGFSLLVVGTLLGAILTGLLTAVITEDVLGIRLSVADAWQRTRHRLWPLVGLALVTTLLELLGLLPCLVLGVWLWGIWAVSVPAMMVEGTSIRGSLRRSRQLVQGMFWRVWGIRALGALLVTVVASIIGAPFQVAGLVIDGFDITPGSVPTALILLSALGTVISTTFTAPVRAAIDVLLYVDLRMRKEGLDLVLQQRASARPALW